jgi:AcrR family transcriptional regulator
MTGQQQAAPKSRPLRGHAREALIEAASRRFYADGLAGTGIDAITAEAGVAKKSLYNNFSSKAELVTAYLNTRHEEWMGLYRKRLESAAGPKERVLAVFDAYADHAGLAYERGFRGCGLLNAAAELPAGDSGREVVRRHKEEVEGLLSGHLGELLPDAPKQAAPLARHLAYLLEGSMVRAGLEGDDGCVKEARRIASGLIGNL